MNTKQIEVRDQDAAAFRLMIRKVATAYRREVEEAEGREHPEDITRMRWDLFTAKLLSEQAAGSTASKFTGDLVPLTDAAAAMLRDLIGQASELADYGPLSCDRLEVLAEDIAWWSRETGRLYSAQTEAMVA